MKWANLTDFISMGGYGLYVWGSYLATAALIAIEVVMLGVRQRTALERPSEPLPERQPE